VTEQAAADNGGWRANRDRGNGGDRGGRGGSGWQGRGQFNGAEAQVQQDRAVEAQNWDRRRRGDGQVQQQNWQGQQDAQGQQQNWQRDRRTWQGSNSQNWQGDRRNWQSDSRRWANTNNWNRNWRNDRRYDWRDYREHNRSRFHIGVYYDPFGWGYQPYSIGYRLYPGYFSRSFWINDPWSYRLPYAPPGTQWVRYDNDALLVDVYTGEVVDVIRDFFW
jgi:hypothetical protein